MKQHNRRNLRGRKYFGHCCSRWIIHYRLPNNPSIVPLATWFDSGQNNRSHDGTRATVVFKIQNYDNHIGRRRLIPHYESCIFPLIFVKSTEGNKLSYFKLLKVTIDMIEYRYISFLSLSMLVRGTISCLSWWFLKTLLELKLLINLMSTLVHN